MIKNIRKERGLFWIHTQAVPDHQFAPDSSISGTLNIHHDGTVSLDLDAMLTNADDPLSGLATSNKPLIFMGIQGKLKTSGDYVLIPEAYQSGGRFSSSGISYQKFSGHFCLIGSSLFASNKALTIKSFDVNLSGYEEWLRLSSIKIKQTSRTISATYKRIPEINYKIGKDKIEFIFDIVSNYPMFSGKTKMKEKVRVSYKYNKLTNIKDTIFLYSRLADLFILLTGSTFSMEFPEVNLSNKSRYKLYYFRQTAKSKRPKAHECWTNFRQIKDDFGNIFSNWINGWKVFGPGYYSYLGTQRGMSLYEEHRFINLIWGIESLHRTKNSFSSNPTPLTQKIERILSDVKLAKDKKWLQKKLRHVDEPKLEDRIYSTLRTLPIDVEDVRLKDFSKLCARLRNDLSHFGQAATTLPGSGEIQTLNILSNALSYLYHALLLIDIGVKPDIIRVWFSEGFKYFQFNFAFVKAGLYDKETLAPPKIEASA
jgi:hypothetical protein